MENNSSEILKDKILKVFDSSNLSMPNHVGIIMDGNRRWAAENKKPVFFGHKEGTKNLESLIKKNLIPRMNLVLIQTQSKMIQNCN